MDTLNKTDETITFDLLANNAHFAPKKQNYQALGKFNKFFKDATNRALENNEFPLFSNEENIVDTSVPVVHDPNGMKKQFGTLYLLLREKQQNLGAETPEFVTMDTIHTAKLAGIDVSIKENEKSVFYPSNYTDSNGNVVDKNIYYLNISQLNNPENLMNFIKERYKERQHQRNVVNKAKFDAGEYEEFYEANEEYPEYKGVNPEISCEPLIPDDLKKRYEKIEKAKLDKTVDMEEYKKQSAEVKKDISLNIMASILKAGESGICIKMFKGDNELFKEGIQTVTKDTRGYLPTWCKEAQRLSARFPTIEMDKSIPEVAVASQVKNFGKPEPAKKRSVDDSFGFDR